MNYLRLAAAVTNYALYARSVDHIPKLDGVEICLDQPAPTYIHVYRHGVSIFTLTLVSNVWQLETSDEVLAELATAKVSGESWARIFFERYRHEYERLGLKLIHVADDAPHDSDAMETMTMVRSIAGKGYFEMQTGKHRTIPVEEDLFYKVLTVKADAHLSFTRGKHHPAGAESTEYFVRDDWDAVGKTTMSFGVAPPPQGDHDGDTRDYFRGCRPSQAQIERFAAAPFKVLDVTLRRQRQELVHKGTPLKRKARYSKCIQRIALKASNQQQDCTLTVYEHGQGMAKLAVPSVNSPEVYYFHGSTALQMMNKLLRKPYLSH